METPLIEQVKRLRAAQAAREADELTRLVKAYQTIDRATQKDAELLARVILEKYGGGIPPTADQIRRLSRYRELMDVVEKELGEYQSFMHMELRSQSRLELELGEKDARTLATISARGAGLDVGMRAINLEVIEQLVGFLDPRGPLYERLGLLPGWTAEQVAEQIIEGIGRGLNPRTTAAVLDKRIRDAVTQGLGRGLTSSLSMMRTVQLYSYREANRASYVANADVVTSWQWYAELDGLTCPSCIAMHGTIHPLTETLNDHHQGRCTMLPVTVGERSDITSGEEWFKSLNEEEQRDILGRGRFDAWKEGKFALADISTERKDDVYGLMRHAKTLEELTGGK